LEAFLSKKLYRLKNLKKALVTSSEDILSDSCKLINEPKFNNYLRLQKRLFNSSTWVGKSSFRLLWPKEKKLINQKMFLQKNRSKLILNAVKNKDKIEYKDATHQEIFETIFSDLDYSRKNYNYKSSLSVPKTSPPILLVSGVLNEIFSTAAFERGAKYLKKEYDIDYLICETSGLKSVSENSDKIKDQIELQFKKHNKKLWVVAFSKGGVDFLHFMKDYPELAEKCVGGLSTIASPILGSNRINHKVINLINYLHKLSHYNIYQKLDDKFDLLLKDFQQSISSEFQEGWFKENFHYLPKDIFYSAVALKTNWYESHVWMILTKLFFQSSRPNDGIVDVDSALYPSYFNGVNLGVLGGHHLIGTRTSEFSQESLLEAHIIFRDYIENSKTKKDRP
jgi:hypothetical protein